MHPKVSILIPCWNAERWIAQAIRSALEQTYPNKEVIVIDDGSTDNSLGIIKKYGDFIHWETQTNHGGNSTRNRLLALSTGDWVQYLDADDYLLPDKIERQVQVLAQGSQADILYSASILEYYQGDEKSQEILSIPHPHDPWVLLARWYLPQTGSPLWRKQSILDVGGWKIGQPCCQEHELYLRLLRAGRRFQYVDYAGSVYRQWSESTVCKRDKPETYRRRLEILEQMEAHLKTTVELSPERQWAINQSRFECARQIWLFAPSWAKEIMAQVNRAEPNFLPTGVAAPPSYQYFYKIFGFSWAETIAALRRRQTLLLRFFTRRNKAVSPFNIKFP